MIFFKRPALPRRILARKCKPSRSFGSVYEEYHAPARSWDWSVAQKKQKKNFLPALFITGCGTVAGMSSIAEKSHSGAKPDLEFALLLSVLTGYRIQSVAAISLCWCAWNVDVASTGPEPSRSIYPANLCPKEHFQNSVCNGPRQFVKSLIDSWASGLAAML